MEKCCHTIRITNQKSNHYIGDVSISLFHTVYVYYILWHIYCILKALVNSYIIIKGVYCTLPHNEIHKQRLKYKHASAEPNLQKQLTGRLLLSSIFHRLALFLYLVLEWAFVEGWFDHAWNESINVRFLRATRTAQNKFQNEKY